jgi:UDP-glucose 6-dehydrogenase
MSLQSSISSISNVYLQDNFNCYDKTELFNTIQELNKYNYTGLIVIKSTVEPGETENISKVFPSLKIMHNPEFLTARTATHDFLNQKHIILGFTSLVNINSEKKEYDIIINFYKKYFPNALISICNSTESECMKIACNSFYATKIQFFTEIKLLCDSIKINYDNVKQLMLNNEWINPMHTNIPGHDGQLSFGGACLPKDIKALNSFMKRKYSPHKVINAVIEEHKKMRK